MFDVGAARRNHIERGNPQLPRQFVVKLKIVAV